MEDKMFNIMDKACEKGSEFTGVKFSFPRPSKRSLEVTSGLNALVGVGLCTVGVATKHRWGLILGAAGIANAIYVKNKVNRLKKK